MQLYAPLQRRLVTLWQQTGSKAVFERNSKLFSQKRTILNVWFSTLRGQKSQTPPDS